MLQFLSSSVWGGVTDSWFPGSRRRSQLYSQVMLLSMVSLGSIFSMEKQPTVDYYLGLSTWNPMLLHSLPPFRRKDNQEWISQYFSTTIHRSSTEENFVLENPTWHVRGKEYSKSMGSSIPSTVHLFVNSECYWGT